MGNKASSGAKNAAKVEVESKTATMDPPETAPTSGEEFILKKSRPGCTGMFWRSDPTGANSLQNNNNWPRDEAKLRGTVVTHRGEKWLLATEVQQKGTSTWKKAPVGAAMPFEYNSHYYLASASEK